MASYVVLWCAVGVLLVVVLALVRQIGVLHTRLDDVRGAGDAGDASAGDGRAVVAAAGGMAGADAVPAAPGGAGAAADGPPLGTRAPMAGRLGYERAPITLVAFTAESCELSQLLAPSLRVVDKQYDDVRVVELPLGPRTIAAFEAFNVSHTPFVVAVGQDGRVRGRGRARNLQQLEMFVERALAVAAKAAGRAAGEAVVDLRGASTPGLPQPESASALDAAPAAAAPVDSSVPDAADTADTDAAAAVGVADAAVADARADASAAAVVGLSDVGVDADESIDHAEAAEAAEARAAV